MGRSRKQPLIAGQRIGRHYRRCRSLRIGPPFARRKILALPNPFGKGTGADDLPLAFDIDPFENVTQLAHIAGPQIGLKQRSRFIGQALNAATVLFIELIEKILGQLSYNFV